MSDYTKKQDVLDILYNTFDEYSMTTDKQDKLGGFGAEVFKRVKELPTVDEKEIIRKAMERILTRLEKCEDDCGCGKIFVQKAIEFIKEEGGIE